MLALLVLAVPLAALLWVARQALARLVLIALLRTVYRLRAFGRENVPAAGGALLVPNHVSMIDGLWVGAVLPRTVYFLMHRDFVKTPIVGPFTRMMGTIPVATGDTPEAKAESLRRAGERCSGGDLVCIFAEGVITRSGALMPFMRGLETIARAGRAPIVPVALDRVWGSLFSFSGGRFIWKRPRRLPYPIDVVFGVPLAHDAPAWRVRDAVAELLARHREDRAGEVRPLGYRFVRSARKNARHPAIVGLDGRVTTYAELLRDVLALRSAWTRVRAERALDRSRPQRVAVLLPHGADAAAVHLVLALERELALPLDVHASPAANARRCTAARADWIVGDRATLDAATRERFGARAIDVAELRALAEPVDRALARLLELLPGPVLARTIDPALDARAPLVAVPSDAAASTRAVVLSHANVASNVASLAQAFDFGPEDRVLAAGSIDDALGELAGVWLPLLTGAAVVVRPRERGRALADAIRRERVTVVPLAASEVEDLLQHATREDLASVRAAFCDGSRVEPELFERWNERFGRALWAGWGLPELAPVATISLRDIESGKWLHTGSKPRAVGRALSGVALRVVAADGSTLPPGERGELLVRGPGVMTGYLDDRAATERVLRDGWLATGLAATIDKDGFLFLDAPAA